MAQYIDKTTLVAEIEKRMKENKKSNWQFDEFDEGYKSALEDILSFPDTIEVKGFWKLANGDDLPDIDREVIVLTQHYPLEGSEYAVSFAHRPNPNGWEGKSVITGKVEHYTPKTYDKGGWNIPNVKWWLDLGLPGLIDSDGNIKE